MQVVHCYSRHPRAQASWVGERVVLFHRDTQTTTVLNPSGSRIWELLEATQNESALAAALSSEYPGLSCDQAQADVSAFMVIMIHNELVRVES